MLTLRILSLLLLLHLDTLYADDLLQNSDFEHPHDIAPWTCLGCHASIVQTSYHGKLSLKVTNRNHGWTGLTQAINAQGGETIKCRAYIKLLNMPQNKMYVKVETMVSYTMPGGRFHRSVIGRDSYHQMQYDWAEIGGDLTLPAGVHSTKFFINVDDPSVDYLLDYSSCHLVTSDPQWKTKANERIDRIRKRYLNITVTSSGQIDTSGLTVQIKQTSSKFAFGTAVKAPLITDPTKKVYQDFVYNNFEWAVIENALKWKLMEKSQGHADYAKGMNAVRELRKHGIKVRGHNMFWAGDRHVPSWVNNMPSSQLLQEMHKRVNGMISHSNGTLEHWDVNNEKLHGDFYARHIKNPNITMEMFKWIHALEPNVKLFLNEFQVVNQHLATTAYKSQGKRFKDSGIPIYGMGVQSHLKTSQHNMDVLKYRLDKIAQSGLPIWITEFSILDSNENTKAATLDDVMTLYFSHWAVEGVLLWGFWDSAVFDSKIALATGTSVTPNAAGRKWQELFLQRFRTNETHSFNGQTTVNTKIFMGEHQLIFKHHGNTIHTENVNLLQGQKAVVHLQSTGPNIQVSHVAFG